MKGLSLLQPWASLMAFGAKRIETRDWPTAFRGDVAIVASRGFRLEERDLCLGEPFCSTLLSHGVSIVPAGRATHVGLPLGAVLCVVEVTGCFPTAKLAPRIAAALLERRDGPAKHDLDFGNYAAIDPTSQRQRYGFVTTNLRPLREPVPVEHMERGAPKAGGALGFYDLSPACEAAVRAQLDQS